MSTPQRAHDHLITAEEFAQLPDGGRRYELVRGVVCEMSPTNDVHGLVASQIDHLLRLWNRPRRAGRVRIESGFVLAREPDTVRGPDVSFVRRARDGVVDGPWVRGGPDLAVEIRSPGDRRGEIDERVEDYLRAGRLLVWVVDPARRTIVVRTPGAPDRMLPEQDDIDGGDVLPGFSVPVREVFEDLD
jgi:Uma2 family endonuclease